MHEAGDLTEVGNVHDLVVGVSWVMIRWTYYLDMVM